MKTDKKTELADTAEFLTPSEARKVRHGLKQAREGKTQSWDKVKRDLGL